MCFDGSYDATAGVVAQPSRFRAAGKIWKEFLEKTGVSR
jgi:hypothetical protein